MKNKYINYTEYENRLNLFKNMQLIPKKSKVKISCGISCLIVGIIPNGLGFVFYPLGFMLLGIKREYVINKVYNCKIKLKYGRFV